MDGTGRPSWSIPVRRLGFPPLRGRTKLQKSISSLPISSSRDFLKTPEISDDIKRAFNSFSEISFNSVDREVYFLFNKVGRINRSGGPNLMG
jgi:hypothetical protein